MTDWRSNQSLTQSRDLSVGPQSDGLVIEIPFKNLDQSLSAMCLTP